MDEKEKVKEILDWAVGYFNRLNERDSPENGQERFPEFLIHNSSRALAYLFAYAMQSRAESLSVAGGILRKGHAQDYHEYKIAPGEFNWELELHEVKEGESYERIHSSFTEKRGNRKNLGLIIIDTKKLFGEKSIPGIRMLDLNYFLGANIPARQA